MGTAAGDIPAVSTIPLDDISHALHESYLKGNWSHKAQAGQVPPDLYAAVLRVLLLPWNEPPQAVAASLQGRLQRGKDLAAVLGASPAVHEQVCVEGCVGKAAWGGFGQGGNMAGQPAATCDRSAQLCLVSCIW